LHRWLTYLDPRSPKELVEEVIKMDMAIQEAEAKMRTVTRDKESLRLYEIREKALHDWTSGVNNAKREGKLEIAQNMKADSEPIEKIMRYTNLTRAEVENLT
jgi:predicted transposase/invertase (TIGR01784 family)